MLTPDEAFAREMALFYRSKKLNPIPSAIDAKKFLYRFAEEYGRETMFPEEWFTAEAWERRPTTNLQILCGTNPWRLLVIDLDGSEAKYLFKQWGKTPRTWTVHREDGDSWHLWFRTPADSGRIPTKFLWKGDGDHQAVERICDGSQIVAPPSFHVVHRQSRYRFLNDDCSPRRLKMPADCPRWILDRKPIETRRDRPEFVPPRPKVATRAIDPGAFISRNELLDRLHDKIGIAKEWNIRFTGKVSHDGWAECHAIGRPDHKPSAAMNIHSGVYSDRGNHESLSFFDCMIATGNAHDFEDACASLMQRIS